MYPACSFVASTRYIGDSVHFRITQAARAAWQKNMNRLRLLAVLLLPILFSGCGVLAAPCRIASAGIKMVPIVGHAAALPTDACAAVIDP